MAGTGKEIVMKAYFLFTASGPLAILTSYDSIQDPKLLERLAAKVKDCSSNL